jgi:hypothetical protein
MVVGRVPFLVVCWNEGLQAVLSVNWELPLVPLLRAVHPVAAGLIRAQAEKEIDK